MRRPRGVSVAEALVTSFALLLALGMVATLANEYTRAMSFSAEKDRVMYASRTVLDVLRGDLEASFDPIDLSNPGQPRFRMVNQGKTPEERYEPTDEASTFLWKPDAAPLVQDVAYRLDGDVLYRAVVGGGEVRVATGLQGFSVTAGPPTSFSYQVELTFMEPNRKLRKVYSTVCRKVGTDP